MRPKYDHAEAFMIMKYATRKDGPGPDPIVERIWNSRDGVTPFGVRSKDGQEMQHVDWRSDVYSPHHPHTGLKVGDRIFVDMTREAAEDFGRKRREAWHEDYKKYLAKRWAPVITASGDAADEYQRGIMGLMLEQACIDRGGSESPALADLSVPYPDHIPARDEWDEIIESMVESWAEPGVPNLVTVDEAMLAQLRRQFPKPLVHPLAGQRFA